MACTRTARLVKRIATMVIWMDAAAYRACRAMRASLVLHAKASMNVLVLLLIAVTSRAIILTG
jgi:hypothetical protein